MSARGVGFLLVAALVAGEVTGWPVVDRLALGLLGLLVSAWLWSRITLRGVGITRAVPSDRAQVGQVFSERVEVHNHGRLAKLWIEVIDYSTLPDHAVSRVVHLRGRRTVSWQVDTLCTRRGQFRLGPAVARSGDPLGLFTERRTIPETRELVVYPAEVPLTGFVPPAGLLSGGQAIDRRNPFVTPSVSGIRDYIPGDPFGRISWAATARLGRMMVKEFDLDPTADVWLLLDLHREVQAHAARPSRVTADAEGVWPIEAWLHATDDYAVTVVASLARWFIDRGRNVGLISSGAHYQITTPERSARQRLRLIETLAVVRADGDRPLAEVLLSESRRFSRQTSVVVVTPSTDETWVSALAEIAGRHVHSAAVVVEPDTFSDAPSSLMVVTGLLASGIPTYLVKRDSDISASLATIHGSVAAPSGTDHG